MQTVEFQLAFRKEDAHGPLHRAGCPFAKLYGGRGHPQWPAVAVEGFLQTNARVLIDIFGNEQPVRNDRAEVRVQVQRRAEPLQEGHRGRANP